MPKVIIAAGSPTVNQKWVEAFAALNPHWSVYAWQEGQAGDLADYAVVWQPSAELFQQQTALKAVFNLGAGVDALNLEIFPTHLPIYRLEDAGMAHQMAEYAVYGILLATKRFAVYEQQRLAKQWKKTAPVYREDYPIGVMGMGVIGQQVVKALAALGYPLHVWTRTARDVEGVSSYHGSAQWNSFLQHSRILINVLPLTNETRGILNAQAFAQLLPDAYLINMARGAHIVDDDLLKAIQTGQLTGALLDAFTIEPLPESHPFWQQPAIQITPHISGMTIIPETVRQLSKKLNDLEQTLPVTGLVKRELGY